MRRGDHDPVVVVGAGPHGLAVAAHLLAAGVPTRCFGEPLEFWRRHMPAGMVLRSRKRSTHISDPRRELTIEGFERAQRAVVRAPSLLLEQFIEYGLWFQRRGVPDLDRRKLTELALDDGHFAIVLEDSERLRASRVVIAAGVLPFAIRPAPFAALPASHVSHSFDHPDLGIFAGSRVLVVGAGQSALESAALLHECGAHAELLIRAPSVHWLWSADSEEPVPEPEPRRTSPPTDVGGGLAGWLVAAPDAFRRLPPRVQDRVAYRVNRPAGSGWLRPRLRGVPVSRGRTAVAVEASGGRARVLLDDGTQREVDHVLLGTGYAVDVRRYPFIARGLASQIATAAGYPVLGPGLECSVPGLHFVGAPAAVSFGPIMRFVVGTQYAAPALLRRVLGRRQPPIRFSF
jgi:cation diffusion facilitator CzcD-associated flavoprotein CzcO